MPRADQGDGLVALASIVSKTVRELWMDVFNAYWCRRIPGLAADGRLSRRRRAVPRARSSRSPRPRASIRPTGGGSSRS